MMDQVHSEAEAICWLQIDQSNVSSCVEYCSHAKSKFIISVENQTSDYLDSSYVKI